MAISALSFKKLQNGYPNTYADVMKQVFEGTSNYKWLKGGDSCTVRLSLGLIAAGKPIKNIAGVYCVKGADKKWYMLRADEAARIYFPKQFGAKPDVKMRSTETKKLKEAIADKKGVLFFKLVSDKGVKKGMFGHADLWDGSSVWYNDILHKTHEVWLYEVGP